MNESMAAGVTGGPLTSGTDPGPRRWPFRLHRQLPLSTLLSLLTFATLLPFLALGAYVLASWLMDERNKEISRLSEIAADLARAVDRDLRGHIETAEVVAASRSLQRGDIAAFRQIAEDAASRANGHIILIDRNFQQLVNTRAPSNAVLPKTANSASAQAVFDTGNVVVGNLAMGAVAQKLLFSVRLPIRVNGEIRYVLSYVPRQDAVLRVVMEAYRPEGWFAAVVDGNGKIIARSSRHEDFYGKSASPKMWEEIQKPSGLVESVDLEGRSSLAAFRSSSISKWKVVVWAPRDILEEPVWKASRLLVMLAGLALAGSIIVAYFTGRLIRKPTAMLLAAADQLGRGEPVEFQPTAMQEANVVGEALKQASSEIQSREASLRDTEVQRRFVMRELSHRSKNLLAVIQAMVGNSLRMAASPEQFKASLTERLAGLARSHDLLVQTDWSRVGLEELLKSHLSAFDDPADSRLAMAGPKVLLSPQAAQHLGMAFHELATNALKYGALSRPAGRVTIHWNLKPLEGDKHMLVLRWEETGGPRVKPPTRRGFGSTVIEKFVASGPGSTSKLEWRREGLVWNLEMEL